MFGYLDGPHPGEVIVLYLAVKQREAPLPEAPDEVDQADFRGIGHAAEHGLAHERPAKRNAVEATGQSTTPIRLDAMGHACLVQAREGQDDSIVDPGFL